MSSSFSSAICNQICQNGGECVAPGECSCRRGYAGNSCEMDLDECASNMDNCHETSTCVNMPGWYYCRCKPGYRIGLHDSTQGTQCIDIDECNDQTIERRHTCHPSATCINTEGGYMCSCPPRSFDNHTMEECRLSKYIRLLGNLFLFSFMLSTAGNVISFLSFQLKKSWKFVLSSVSRFAEQRCSVCRFNLLKSRIRTTTGWEICKRERILCNLNRLLVRGTRGDERRDCAASRESLQKLHLQKWRRHVQGSCLRLQRPWKSHGQMLPPMRPRGLLQASRSSLPDLQKWRTMDISVSNLRMPGNGASLENLSSKFHFYLKHLFPRIYSSNKFHTIVSTHFILHFASNIINGFTLFIYSP